MAMPFFHPERWANPQKFAPTAFEDDLPLLADLGIGAVVSLLDANSAHAIYASAAIDFLCLPIVDGTEPSVQQAHRFVRFADERLATGKAVAVHCAAGLGRTGTMLAAYLIAHGSNAPEAIRSVRQAQPAAIETRRQVEFLHQFARR